VEERPVSGYHLLVAQRKWILCSELNLGSVVIEYEMDLQ
jgi:hypothetical protein